jgi:hypothetical protein
LVVSIQFEAAQDIRGAKAEAQASRCFGPATSRQSRVSSSAVPNGPTGGDGGTRSRI